MGTDVEFNEDDQIYQSITYKIGKNITITSKSILPSIDTETYDDAIISLKMDFEDIQDSDLITKTDNQVARLDYCIRTELYHLSGNSIPDMFISYVQTRFSIDLDLSYAEF